MAKILNNLVLEGASGKLGNLIVFKQLRGKTIIALKGAPAAKSPKQKERMEQFRKAAKYAKEATTKEEMKERYRQGVTDRKHTPYLVAIADYLNAPEIHKVDASEYNGGINQKIVIIATDDFMVDRVIVEILLANGSLIESGSADNIGNGTTWIYTSAVDVSSAAGIQVKAVAYDLPGNASAKVVDVFR